MFRKPSEKTAPGGAPARVDSVLGPGISWKGEVGGTGGLRIDGAFDGESNAGDQDAFVGRLAG